MLPDVRRAPTLPGLLVEAAKVVGLVLPSGLVVEAAVVLCSDLTAATCRLTSLGFVRLDLAGTPVYLRVLG